MNDSILTRRPARARRLAVGFILFGGLIAMLPVRFARAESAQERLVTVIFEVGLPPGTPDGPVYIAGNQEAVGGWKADGFRLDRTGRDFARGSVSLPAAAALEFKVTRGSWATVEKTADFAEVANRRFVPLETGEDLEKPLVIRLAVAAWADSSPPRSRTLSGDIRFHEDFKSSHLGNSRTIAVYLPPGYGSSRKRYPVLYMHDGQNIFDASTSFIGVEWGVDEACEKLIAGGSIEPLIVVGVYNNDRRVDEYTPVGSTNENRRGGGQGDLYGRFLVEEVKPFIDATYRTRPGRATTSIMGSSLGGLISLHLAWTRPDVFSSAGVVSPALWWGDSEILKRIEHAPAPAPKPRLWIDMGTREGDSLETFKDSVREVTDLSRVLRSKGWREGRNLVTFIHEGADHSERAWNARIETILKYLYGRPAARAEAAASGRR